MSEAPDAARKEDFDPLLRIKELLDELGLLSNPSVSQVQRSLHVYPRV
jgi:hypothetical protein